MPALWTLTLADLGLSTRAKTALCQYDARKAWHAAAICQRCLKFTRNCGRTTCLEIATVLQHHGFPVQSEDCGRRTLYRSEQRTLSPCAWALQRCRAMLERGEWN